MDERRESIGVGGDEEEEEDQRCAGCAPDNPSEGTHRT